MTSEDQSGIELPALRSEPEPAKLPWAKPELQRMRAGSAEVGTRAANDGAFTTS